MPRYATLSVVGTRHEREGEGVGSMKAAGKRHAERASAERAFSSCLQPLIAFFLFVIRAENRATKTAGVNTAALRITIV